MGIINGNSPGLFAWERWVLGWLNTNQIICLDKSPASYLITPIERKDGDSFTLC
jgi:hypothetical protein